MFVSQITHNLSHFYYLGIWNELCDIDFTHPKISSKNGKVTYSPDAHYLENESCWTIGNGFFQIETSLFPTSNKRYFLTITHADPALKWDDSKVQIKVNGETVATLTPPKDSYGMELVEITEYLRAGKNTLRLDAVDIQRYQIQKITLIEDIP